MNFFSERPADDDLAGYLEANPGAVEALARAGGQPAPDAADGVAIVRIDLLAPPAPAS